MRIIRIIQISICLIISSCSSRYGNGKDVLRSFDEIESYINEHPDSALLVLTSMDSSLLDTKQKLARYSLLYSMALDKCYIDTTDLSIISPACDYYRSHGDPDHRLKTFYYRARISENAGDLSEAMNYLVDSEKYSTKANDHSFVGKYFLEKARLYFLFHDFEKSVLEGERAKKHYLICDEDRGLATACIVLAENYKLMGKDSLAYSNLNMLHDRWNRINDFRKCEYYRLQMSFALSDGLNEKAMDIYEDCMSEIKSPTANLILAMANVLLKNGYPEYAVSYLQALSTERKDSSAIFMLFSDSYASMNDYRRAYEYSDRLLRYRLDKELMLLSSDMPFIEERHDYDQQQRRSLYSLFSLTFLLILATTLFLIFSFRLRTRHVILRRQVLELKQEKEVLETMRLKGVYLSEETILMVNSRLDLLNKALLAKASWHTSFSKAFSDNVNEIVNNRHNFLSSITLMFTLEHQGFISTLKGYGLSEDEIGYCCMFIQGLSAKEVSNILNLPRIYQYSSTIRQKLGLTSRGSNLRTYLLSIL